MMPPMSIPNLLNRRPLVVRTKLVLKERNTGAMCPCIKAVELRRQLGKIELRKTASY